MLTKLFFIGALTPLSLWSLTVVLDPGHGGLDKGAVYGAAEESKIVLLLGQKIKTLLEHDSVKEKFTVTLTRSKDEFVSLKQRVNLSKKWDGDLFVSLHANASSDQRAYGLEFFMNTARRNKSFSPLAGKQAHQKIDLSSGVSSDVSSGVSSDVSSGASSDGSSDSPVELSKSKDVTRILKDIRQNIQSQKSLKLTRVLQADLPGSIKQAPFYVLAQTQIPSVLIEVGFLSHPKDNKKLLNEDYRNDLAIKIADSIKRYARSNYPEAATEPNLQSNSLDENTSTPR